MSNQSRYTKGFLLSLLVGTCLAPAAWAQQKSSGILEEVVVTAERRETNVQNTPISVVAISADTLTKSGITNTQQLQNLVPNLSIGGTLPLGNKQPQFVLRGVGQASGDITADKGVALYIDDAYYPRSTGSFLRLLDVERVEVLRGPQGTLFGRNATGGAVRYITRKPTDKFEGQLNAAYGSFNRVDLSGLVNIPLSDKAAVRLQAGSWTRDGFVSVVPNGVGNNSGEAGKKYGKVDEQAVRAQIRFRPTDELTIDFGVAFTRSETNGEPLYVSGLNARLLNANFVTDEIDAYNTYLSSIGKPPIAPKSPGTRESDDPRFLSGGDYSVPDNCILSKVPNTLLGNGAAGGASLREGAGTNLCTQYSKDRAAFAHLDIHWQVSEQIHLRSLTAWERGTSAFNLDSSGFGFIMRNSVLTMPSWSEELQAQGDYGRLRWVTGATYFSETPTAGLYERFPIVDGAGKTVCCQGPDNDTHLDATAWGIYAEANYDVTSKLTITGGARYSNDRKSISIVQNEDANPANLLKRQSTDSWNSFDYRLTGDYKFSDDVSVYATQSTGYKAGGINGSVITSPGDFLKKSHNNLLPYDPEKVVNDEVGLRSEWLNHRLRLNLTAYTMNYKNLLINSRDFTAPLGTDAVEVNAGRVRLSGVEAEVVVIPTTGLRLNASLGTLDVSYKYLLPDSPLFENYPGADHQMTCPTAVHPWTFAQGCQAFPLQFSPKLSYNLGASYTHAMGEGDLTATAAYNHVSTQRSSNIARNALLIPAYGLLNLRLQYDLNKWTVALTGSNVLGEHYLLGGGMGRLTPFYTVYGNLGEPTMWAIELQRRL